MKNIVRQLFLGFFRKSGGSAMIEFAIVAPVLFLLIFGLTEFGLFTYHKIIIEGIAVDISRVASIGKSSDSACSGFATRESYIKCLVNNRASVMINGDRTEVQINTLTAGGTLVPDICFDVDPPSSAPVTCTTYEDVNGNGVYTGIAASNAGNAGEVIEVRISYPWKVQIPLLNKFFKTVDSAGAERNVIMISAATVIKNEPF